MDTMLSIEPKEPKSADMEVDTLNPTASSLRNLNVSSTEKFLDSFTGNMDMMFVSFDIYDTSHPVSEDLMKDISKPICLHGLRFSRVTQQTECMNRTASFSKLIGRFTKIL